MCSQIHRDQVVSVAGMLSPYWNLHPDQMKEDALWHLLDYPQALEAFDKYPQLALAKFFRKEFGLTENDSVQKFVEERNQRVLSQAREDFEDVLFRNF